MSTTQIVTVAEGEEPKAEQMDSFGRTAAERTVELLPVDAEAVNTEVEAGSHETYEGALAYIIQRGLAEIKRSRDAAAKLKEKTKIADQVKLYKEMVKANPKLLADADFSKKFTELMLQLS